MALCRLLRRFDFTVLKNRSATDTAQVPAVGTFTFFKQGASVRVATTLHPTDPPTERTLTVNWPGQLVVGDSFTIGFNGPAFVVTQVTQQTIEFLYDSTTSLSVPAGTRLVAPELPVFRDILGEQQLTAPYVSDGTSGRFACFVDAPRFDFQVGVSGSGLRYFTDWQGGPAIVLPSEIDARDFPNLGSAVQACPDGVETTLRLAGGVYYSTESLVIPPSKRVRLLGAGQGQTVIHCPDPTKDVVWVKGDGCSLQDLTVRGAGAAAANQSEYQGRGVVIGKLGAEATGPTRDFWMSNVNIRETASWGLWCIGSEDPGGVESKSLVILSRFERSTIEQNSSTAEQDTKWGLVRTRRGCTTLDFNNIRMIRPAGFGALVENNEQITFSNCVFEDSDDTQPYFEMVNSTSSALIQCWFEHHGGWVAPRSSNTQRFVRIRNYCRGTTLLGCHFVRNAADAPSTVRPGNPFAIEVGETNADPAARARSTILLNCDFNVPGEIAGDDHIVTRNGSDVVVLASRVQSTNEEDPPVPQFTSPAILEEVPAASASWSTLIGWAGRIRLPRYKENDPRNAELEEVETVPGDVRYNVGIHRVEVRTDQGWMKLVMEP